MGSEMCIRDRELGADNAVVFYRSAQIEKMLNNQTDALKYIDRAIAVSYTHLTLPTICSV